jgi:hypothetical protein
MRATATTIQRDHFVDQHIREAREDLKTESFHEETLSDFSTP